MASNTYHEPLELLSGDTLDMHRAIVSLMEEMEAIDWYQQRADACTDPALKAVLMHNKNEEIEHAAMVMEWIRRHNLHFNDMMRKYLFTELPIAGVEAAAKLESSEGTAAKTLGIGSLKG